MKLSAVARLSIALLALLLVAPTVSFADEEDSAGHVYVLNNNLAGSNSITVFSRAADGKLSQQGVVPIGGLGSLAAFFDGTEGSLIRTPDGSRLFAVDPSSITLPFSAIGQTAD